jgi:hypothetical protein
MRTRGITAAVGLWALLALPSRASAITTDQVIDMAKGGVSESVILTVIARDNTPFDLDAAQLVALKQAGVSDTIVMAMLKSGRGETQESPITVVGPEVLIIGHGPDIPNTSYWDRLYWNPTYVIPYLPLYPPIYQPLHRSPIKPRRFAR